MWSEESVPATSGRAMTLPTAQIRLGQSCAAVKPPTSQCSAPVGQTVADQPWPRLCGGWASNRPGRSAGRANRRTGWTDRPKPALATSARRSGLRPTRACAPVEKTGAYRPWLGLCGTPAFNRLNEAASICTDVHTRRRAGRRVGSLQSAHTGGRRTSRPGYFCFMNCSARYVWQ